MATPYYIYLATRKNGILHLLCAAHGLTIANAGSRITIVGSPVPSFNGNFQINKIVVPDSIQILQPGPDVDPAVAGGAFAIG